MRLWDIRRAGALHSFDMADTRGGGDAPVTAPSMPPPRRSSYDEDCLRPAPILRSPAAHAAPGGHEMLASEPVRAVAHDGAVTGLLQTPDGRHWVSAGRDNAVRLWDAERLHNCLVRFPEAFNSASAARQIAVDSTSQVRPHQLASKRAPPPPLPFSF